MNKFIVVIFPDDEKAEEAVKAFEALHDDGTVTLYGLVLARKDAGGEVSATEKVGKGLPGTAVGALAGGLIGLLGGPLTAAAGAAGGAWIGTWRDIAHLGVGSEFLEDVARELAPGTTAVIADVTEERVAPVDEQMEALGGVVLREWQSEYGEMQLVAEAAARKTEIEHLAAERDDAPAARRDLLSLKIEKAENRIKALEERARERERGLEQSCDAKLDALKRQAATARPNEKASLERRTAELREDRDRRAALLRRAIEIAAEARAARPGGV